MLGSGTALAAGACLGPWRGPGSASCPCNVSLLPVLRRCGARIIRGGLGGQGDCGTQSSAGPKKSTLLACWHVWSGVAVWGLGRRNVSLGVWCEGYGPARAGREGPFGGMWREDAQCNSISGCVSWLWWSGEPVTVGAPGSGTGGLREKGQEITRWSSGCVDRRGARAACGGGGAGARP